MSKDNVIPFVKPSKPDLASFTTHLTKSIDQNKYSNFGPNEQELTNYLEDLIGYKVICVANATLALDGLHHILSRKVITAYLPSFTFPATNLGCRADNIIKSKTNKYGFAEHYIQGQDNYAVTTVPFGTPVTSSVGHPLSKYWVVDCAAGATPDMSTIKYYLAIKADVVIVSLHATKGLSACEGGFVAFRNKELYEEYKRYINFGWTEDRSLIGIGSNHKMSELSASWCLMKLETFEDDYNRRYKIACKYQRLLVGYDYIFSTQAFWFKSKDGKLFKDKMAERGIEVKQYYTPHLSDSLGYDSIGEDMANNGICLPIYDMPDTELNYIIKSVKECL